MEAGLVGLVGIIVRGKEHVVVPILTHQVLGSDVLESGLSTINVKQWIVKVCLFNLIFLLREYFLIAIIH